MKENFRIESDLLGELQVPADAYYGVQTQRALNNYKISNTRMCDYPDYVIAMACIKLAAAETNISIATDHIQLVLKVKDNGRLYQTYLGERLSAQTDIGLLSQPYGRLSSTGIKGFEAYPVMGTEDYYEPAFELRHADGHPTSILKYRSHSQEAGHTAITLQDDLYPITVVLHYEVFPREDIIRQWSEITHGEKGRVSIVRYASSMLYFEAPQYFLTEFSGDWAEETGIQHRIRDDVMLPCRERLATRR